MLEELKKAAAIEAAKLIEDHSVIGLGSGTTAEFFIAETARRIYEEKLDIKAVATSYDSQMIAYKYRIPLLTLLNVDKISITVDGADEVDDGGNAIKGKGGAQTMEKIIASMSELFVIIADNTKLVNTLGEKSPVPVEVIPQAMRFVMQRLEALGGITSIRISSGKVGPVITDLGNIIIDTKFGEIGDAQKLNTHLNDIPGVVGHGLFVKIANKLIAAFEEDGQIRIKIKQF